MVAVSTGPDSEQRVGTPRIFIKAVERYLGVPFVCDLAADVSNAICLHYFDEAHDSLAIDWDTLGGHLWLNPPYARIAPWVRKAAGCQRAKVCILVPASVGSNWWAEHVHQKCLAVFTSPRIKFVGHKDPYPKDIALLLYNFGVVGYDVWRWDE